jgi:arsenite methyltransferase
LNWKHTRASRSFDRMKSVPALPVDVHVLRDEIQKTYADVSTHPEGEFIFPTGRGWAEDLGYPQPELSKVPDRSVESFAGVANPFALGRVETGLTALDLGCGAGTDLLIAAQMVGAGGRAIGVEMTSAMLARARRSADEMGLRGVEFHEGLIEALPIDDESVDVVISNGVIDLVPDKDAVFSEIDRVLRPGGRLQLADVVVHKEVSEDARKRIDLWTG